MRWLAIKVLELGLLYAAGSAIWENRWLILGAGLAGGALTALWAWLAMRRGL